MLKSTKTHTENDVVVVKIATGEIVLAKYIRTDVGMNGMTALMRPFSLVQSPEGLNTIDFIYGSDKTSEVLLSKEAIIAITKALPELANEYNKITTDLIIPPKPSLIV